MIASLRRMRRCLETETAYQVAHLKLLQHQPGNPFGIVCRPSQTGLIAAMAPRLPLSAYNRVRGLRAGFAGSIAPLQAWYAAAGVGLQSGNGDRRHAEAIPDRHAGRLRL